MRGGNKVMSASSSAGSVSASRSCLSSKETAKPDEEESRVWGSLGIMVLGVCVGFRVWKLVSNFQGLGFRV
jgi:hypothetical protein